METEISKIIRSKRKTIALEIKEDASLVVRAPENVSHELICEFVRKKKVWILGKQKLMRTRKAKVFREFVEGEDFWYLGKIYRLRVVDYQSSPLVFKDKFLLPGRCVDRAREVLIDWYKEQAQRRIKERVELFARVTGVRYGKIKITNAKKRWGSCSVGGNLNFSWRLIMAPLKVIDYVVVHEIVHLSMPSHSKDFWAKVEELMPNYTQPKSWLKENGYLLNFSAKITPATDLVSLQ